MVAAEDIGDLADGLIGIFLTQSGADDLLKVGDGKDTLHHGGVRGDDQVVLVHPHTVVTFAFQHSDDAERNTAEADDLSYRVLAVREKLVDDRLPDKTDLRRRLDVLLREYVAVLYLVPSDVEELLVDTIDGGRRVVGAIDRLAGGVDGRGDKRDVAAFLADVLEVLDFQRLHVIGAEAYSAPHVLSRMDHYHVGSHLADLGLDALLGALADGEHCDDGADTDNDAEHRQESSELVVAQCFQGYSE